MKKVRILQVPPIRFGLVLGLINGVIGMIVAPILLFTLGAAVGVAPVFDVTGAAGPSYVADTTLMRALLGAPQHRFAQQLHTILH